MIHEERSSSEWPPKLIVCVGAVVLKENRGLFVRHATANDRSENHVTEDG